MYVDKILNNILGKNIKNDCKSKNFYKKCEDCNEKFLIEDMTSDGVCKYCAQDR